MDASIRIMQQITKTSALRVDVRKRGLLSMFSEHLNRIENSETEVLRSKTMLDKGDIFDHYESRYNNMCLASEIVTSNVDTVFDKVSDIYSNYVNESNAKIVAEIKAVWLGLRRKRFLRFLTCFIPGAVIWWLMSILNPYPDMIAILPFSITVFSVLFVSIYDLLGYSCDFLKSRKEMKELEARPSDGSLKDLLASDSVLQTKIRNKYNKEKTK